MKTDIHIETRESIFKFRACGIIEQDGKFLLVKMRNNGFFCLPGGHVEIGENTAHAALREMKEETGFDLEIVKLVAITENFFNARYRKGHELAFYYLMRSKRPIPTINRIVTEMDKGIPKRLEFFWWDPKMETKHKIRPDFIRKKLEKRNFVTETVIIRDKEGYKKR